MGVRENKIERYLNERVTELGGLTRKWVCPGHRGVPDRIAVVAGITWFVEVKTRDGSHFPQQTREIKKLRDAGAYVTTVHSHADVDRFIASLKFQINCKRAADRKAALHEGDDLGVDSGPWFDQYEEDSND